MAMRPETAVEKFKKWQTKSSPLLLVLEAGSIRLSSRAVVLDANLSEVSFSLAGERKSVLLLALKDASFEEATLVLGMRGLSGLVITFPHGGTCTAQEPWSNEPEPEPEPENPTEAIQ
jgi:hypothetical protein